MAPNPTYIVALPPSLCAALAAGAEHVEPRADDEPTTFDVSLLVMEFAGSLDPAAAARSLGERGFEDGTWRVVGRCTVSAAITSLVRQMAQDQRLVRMIAARFPKTVDRGALTERALPLLLGIAAAAAVRLRVGAEAAAVAARKPKGAPRSERQRSDAGAPFGTVELESPSLGGGRPTLAPLPRDLTAE